MERRRQEDRRQFDVISTKRIWPSRLRLALCEQQRAPSSRRDRETIARNFAVASCDVSEFFDESWSSFARNAFGAYATAMHP
jgi:hypothetical protein